MAKDITVKFSVISSYQSGELATLLDVYANNAYNARVIFFNGNKDEFYSKEIDA